MRKSLTIAIVALSFIILLGCSKHEQPSSDLKVKINPPEDWFFVEKYRVELQEKLDQQLKYDFVDYELEGDPSEYFVKAFFYVTEHDPIDVDNTWNPSIRCIGHIYPGIKLSDVKIGLELLENEWDNSIVYDKSTIKKVKIDGETFYRYEFKDTIHEQKGMVYEGIVDGVYVSIDFGVHVSEDMKKMEKIIQTTQFN